MSRPLKRVLLTGATGFIGKRILRLLVERAEEVVAIVHRRSIASTLKATNVKVVSANLQNAEELRRILEGCHAVCNAAGFIPSDYESWEDLDRCVESNAVSVARLAQLASKVHALRFVHLSTAALYGFATRPLLEDSPIYPAGRATCYLGTKLLGELLIEDMRRRGDLNAFTLRIASCYGPEMSERSVLKAFVGQAQARLPIRVKGSGTATSDFVYVDDVAEAVLLALQGGEPGIYNIGSGKTHTIRQLAEHVHRTYSDHRLSVIVEKPKEESHPGFAPLNIAKARKAWGFSPRTLRVGLRSYRRWMEESLQPQ